MNIYIYIYIYTHTHEHEHTQTKPTSQAYSVGDTQLTGLIDRPENVEVRMVVPMTAAVVMLKREVVG